MVKRTIVDNLSNFKGHNKASQDQLTCIKVAVKRINGYLLGLGIYLLSFILQVPLVLLICGFFFLGFSG